MNKKCGKCTKTVYPTEELKCLDKSWHKGCFRCWECGMALNMRTYKGFNKLPYCEAHIPKPKATTVAETPELARIAENTKIQSNVKYHAEFEAAKGKFTTVADDPETLRIKQNTKLISNAAYHGELEKKADMDQRRHLTGENGDAVSSQSSGSRAASAPRQERPAAAAAAAPANPQLTRLGNNNYGSSGGGGAGLGVSPHSARTAQASTVIYTSEHGAAPRPEVEYLIWPDLPRPTVNAAPTQKVGSIRDYDPLNDQFGSVAQAARYGQPQPQQQQAPPAQQHHYQPPQHQQPPPQQYGGYQQSAPPQQPQYHHQPPQQQPQQQYGGYQQQYQPQQQHHQQQPPQQQQYGGYRADQGGYRSQQTYRSETQQPPPPQHHHQAPAAQHHQAPAQVQRAPQAAASSGRCYRAMYDYDAADHDEISFRDGDLLVACQPIDDGWMTGTCQRTGQRGMLPANYVEPVDL